MKRNQTNKPADKTTTRRRNMQHKRNDRDTCKEGRHASNSKLNSLDNDPSWYNLYPDLVASTARISAGYPVGINYNITGSSAVNLELYNTAHTMRFYYEHGIGYTQTDRDPVNLAATKLYAYVRHANSGHANYERTDLMLYFLSVIEAYNLIALGMRAYGMINLFNNLNRALPMHVMEAIGWSYPNVSDNAALLRTKLNNAIARVNSLYVPIEMNVAKRWWWLNSNVFTDSEGPKAGFFAYTPSIYRTYEELDGAGYLKANELPDVLTISAWSRALDNVLDKLLDSEDIGIMSGDILKAYQDRVFTLSMVPEDYVTPFIYSEEALAQINNATVLSASNLNSDITQETSENGNSGLRYAYTANIPTNDYRYCSDAVLNFQMPNPDELTTMVNTRMTCVAWDIETGDEITGANITMNTGSEVIVSERIYVTEGQVFDVSPSYADKLADPVIIGIHTSFDFAPLVKLFSTANKVVVVTSHYENIVPVAIDTMVRMHDTALLSLFTALV